MAYFINDENTKETETRTRTVFLQKVRRDEKT